jgi:hypothetical protein
MASKTQRGLFWSRPASSRPAPAPSSRAKRWWCVERIITAASCNHPCTVCSLCPHFPTFARQVYNFKKIETVPTAKDFIDVILSKTQRKTPTVVHPGYNIVRIRQFYMRKVTSAPRAARPSVVCPVLRASHAFPRWASAGQVHAHELPREADADPDRLSSAGRYPPVLRGPDQRAVRPRPLQACLGSAQPGQAAHRPRGARLRQAAQVRRLALPVQVAEACGAGPHVHGDEASEGRARVPGASAAAHDAAAGHRPGHADHHRRGYAPAAARAAPRQPRSLPPAARFHTCCATPRPQPSACVQAWPPLESIHAGTCG